MNEYPECERMAAVTDESHKLGDFLDWLNEQGIHLAEWDHESWSEPRLMPRHERYEALLARFYDIDLVKVEQERRAMLDALRSVS